MKGREDKDYSKQPGEQFVVGGVEPPPVIGHLSGGEPIVKPTQHGRFFLTEGESEEESSLLQVEGHKIILKRKGGESFLK